MLTNLEDLGVSSSPDEAEGFEPRPRKRETLLMSFGPNIAVLSRAYRGAVTQAIAHIGLSQSMAFPLIIISRYGEGLRQGMLASLLGVEGPTLNRSINHLVDMGLIERRDDPNDQRAKTIHLTQAGRETCVEAEKALRAMRSKLFDGLADDELVVVERFIRTMQARLDCAHLIVPPLPADFEAA